ncbi:MAG: vWA domain-containing protein [Desulforhopalus sp.]
MKTHKKGFLTIFFLIGLTGAALAYMGVSGSSVSSPPGQIAANGNERVVSVHTELAQDKVLKGSNGDVSVALTLSAENVEPALHNNIQPVDMVVVLDRSGSMNGQKINDAKSAVINLLNRLTPKDRISLITYSNGVEILAPLMYVNNSSRENLTALVHRIGSGGGTNLGGGLNSGIATLMQESGTNRQQKVILISDGLANHGITSPSALGKMAGNGSEHNLAVSTVGVGYDFNEVLMTTIADHGAGNYYFLENPQAFAKVFEKEFETTRNVAAGALEVRIPLKDGLQLVSAGGFPIKIENNIAIIRPGDLLAGQQRKIFLSYRVPTEKERNFLLGNIQVHYTHNGNSQIVSAPEELHIDCVNNRQEVIASIDEDVWSEQVVKEDYNKLKDNVASAIRVGKKEEALDAIKEYETRTTTINNSVGSGKVSQNLENDLTTLRQSVYKTFAGAPAAVAEKKKQHAKNLQYESYQVRRDKK